MALIGWGLSSCNVFKPLPSSQQAATNNKPSSSAPQFISNMEIKPANNDKKPVKGGTASVQQTSNSASIYSASSVTESLTSLQFKYGILLNVAVEELTNLKLLEAIEDWYGTRYSYGGNTKMGIDCSGFAGMLMMTVFGVTLPRTCREQHAVSKLVNRDQLQQGDLVFFNTRGGVSHVGIYLANNKFIHASTASGVVISDLNEDYYARRFLSAGRVIISP